MIGLLAEAINILFEMIYRVVLRSLVQIIKIHAKFQDSKIGDQLKNRQLTDKTIRALTFWRTSQKSCVLFFCSSAGEYEQAQPLIKKLNERHIGSIIVFFSISGLTFAEKREEECPFILSPLDDAQQWERLFECARPFATIIIRHELWPGFLRVASKHSKLYLANASYTEGSPFKSFWKTHLLKRFDRIFVVDANDEIQFQKLLGVPSDKIKTTGDSKYEQVLQRANPETSKVAELRDRLNEIRGSDRLLIIGSAWLADVRIALKGLNQFNSATKENFHWRVIIAPHDLSDSNITAIQKYIHSCDFNSATFSSWATFSDPLKSNYKTVLILDEMGVLAEAYGLCDAAMVGGANHHRVHNVLEPAAHGLPITHGPCYKSQREAVALVDANISHVTNSPEEFASWLTHISVNGEALSEKLRQHVLSMEGASNKIVSIICQDR